MFLSTSATWYTSWWFIVLLISIIIAYIFFSIYYIARRYVIRQRILKRLVEKKTSEISLKNKELEKNDMIKTRLISIISHDIITPLKFLHIAGKNIVEKKDLMTEQAREEALVEIANTSKELEILSTNILNWIKYQNDDRRLLKEEVNLHQLTEKVFSLLNGMAKQKGIILTNQVPIQFNVRQYAEPLRIVLHNLVTNAINFMDKGHITIIAKKLRNGIVVEVKDEGFGMTQEQIDNILGEQFIVSSTNVDGKKGNGLGYLIIKDLLKVLEGHFTIKSAKNKGTAIKLFFPQVRA